MDKLFIFLLLLIFLAILGIYAYRDINEYKRFKKLKKSADRQKAYKKWIIQSLILFVGMSAAGWSLYGHFVSEFLLAAQNYTRVIAIKEVLGAGGAELIGFFIGTFIAFLAGTAFALRGKKKQTVAGDIEALLARNRAELKWTAGLSVNAGIVEELYFRMVLPALIFGLLGNATVAILVSLLVFGLAHWYQGILGIIGTFFLGSIMMALFIATGSLLAPIALHILLDLRSLVFAPMITGKVHKNPR